MTGAETVAVIIPVHNGAAYLAEAIASVQAQSRAADEVWVVDDGSTDGSRAIAESLRGLRCVALPNRGGQAAALHRGIAESSATLLAFLDADDLWQPDKLERQCAALAAEPGLEAVVGHAEQFCDEPGITVPAVRRLLPARLPSALLLRRAAWHRVGPFRTDSPTFVIDWWARAEQAGLKFRLLDAVLYRRRLHANNLGRDPAMRAHYLSLLAQRLRTRT